MRESGEDAWEDLRGSLDEAVESLSAGIKQALSRFD
jgi:hypothetical protein